MRRRRRVNLPTGVPKDWEDEIVVSKPADTPKVRTWIMPLTRVQDMWLQIIGDGNINAKDFEILERWFALITEGANYKDEATTDETA